ncbi:MAG: sulfate/molybdate ABC transporter ATP-binding protein [Bauldia sp.]|nr:sulfate/molybdate ABC transporter ATP-binding protein [Bauldia sp.]
MDARLGNDVNYAAQEPVTRPAAGTRWGFPVDVSVENVEKAFGETPALHGVSLEIKSGELIALLGPSGSGKTTLLRILAGLDFPTAGRVMFGGEDALSLTVQQRNVGFVFQNYALFRNMRVFDNIAFGLDVRPRGRRPTKKEIGERVIELLKLVQLDGLDKRFPSQLSGGQRQRVALARALAIEPRILLLDEPFGALDAKVRRELRRWLREIHDQTGHTTVFVTHDQEEAIELADRIVVLNTGRIEQIGTPDEIYDAPASPFVAGFIGESNALPVTSDSGKIFLDDRSLDLTAVVGPDGPRVLVFRPHHVDVLGDKPGGIAGWVISERRHGAVRRLEVEIGMKRYRIEVDVRADEPRSKKGDRISVLPNHWWLFDAPATNGAAKPPPRPAAGGGKA